jgi:hypothetical protein
MYGRLMGVSQFRAEDSEDYRGKVTLFKVGYHYLDRVTQLRITETPTRYTDAFSRVKDFTGRHKEYPRLEFLYDD